MAVLDVPLLERHRYTTQTFIPLGRAAAEPVYLVIVAPTLMGQTATAAVSRDVGHLGETVTIQDPPDLKNLKAFVARGHQAVTYAPGTWHSSMVVLGTRRVDFVVVQFANGVGEEDCQEVALREGVCVEFGNELIVAVDRERSRGSGKL
jgi:ureidoglycolate lyase